MVKDQYKQTRIKMIKQTETKAMAEVGVEDQAVVVEAIQLMVVQMGVKDAQIHGTFHM